MTNESCEKREKTVSLCLLMTAIIIGRSLAFTHILLNGKNAIISRLPHQNRVMRTHSPKRTFVSTALTFFNLFQLGAGG